MMKLAGILLFFVFIAGTFADTICYTKSYKANIKTIQVYKPGFELSQPIIQLNTSDKLELHFDDLSLEPHTYKVKFIHCNANWVPSQAMPHECMVSQYEDYIITAEQSFNTNIQYFHYTYLFPNEIIGFKESGNFILIVFDENMPEKPLLMARFMVVDAIINIEGNVRRATRIEDMMYRQEVNFTADLSGYAISNPYKDVTVVIQQNGRWDNALSSLKPRIILNEKLYYDFTTGENTFQGGNEYRYTDIKNKKYINERISRIEYDPGGYMHIHQKTDYLRRFKTYSFQHDINGRFAIHAENTRQSYLEADYMTVHFALDYKAPEVEGDLFLFGELTNWNFMQDYRMEYNFEKKVYETSVFLKQGYYNYMYIFVPRGEAVGDWAHTEGTHSETENVYFIYFYHRKPGVLYDRLVGVKAIKTGS